MLLRRRDLLRLPAALALSPLLVAGCGPRGDFVPSPVIELDVAGPQIPLAVREIRQRRTWFPTRMAPFISHLLPIAPEDIAEAWVAARLVAAGDTGILTATLIDGRVRGERIEGERTRTGLFGTRPAVRYAAVLTMRLEAEDIIEGRDAEATVRAERTLRVDAEAEQEEVTEQLGVLLRALAEDFDQAMQARLSDQFAAFRV